MSVEETEQEEGGPREEAQAGCGRTGIVSGREGLAGV
jgi:hypothetical protein